MTNRLLLITYIMYGLVGCTYDVQNSEDEMTTPRFAQQLSKRGNLNPGGGLNSQVSFQLPHIVNQDTGVADPGNYTLQFNVSDPNTGLNAGDFVRARAEIIWMAGGNSVRRVVNCGNGVSVSGTCEGVVVNIYDDSVTTFGSSFVPYTVAVSLAKGSRPSIQQPPTFSQPPFLLAPGASPSFTIPADAGAVSVFVSVAPELPGGSIGAYQVLVKHLGLTSVAKSYDPRQTDWVPLAPGTNRVQILLDAALTTNVLTQITYGIDG